MIRFLILKEDMYWKWRGFRLELGNAWADIGRDWVEDTLKRIDFFSQMSQMKWGKRLGDRRYGHFRCFLDYEQWGTVTGRKVQWYWNTKAKKEWKKDNRVVREVVEQAHHRVGKGDSRPWYSLQLTNNYAVDFTSVSWEVRDNGWGVE